MGLLLKKFSLDLRGDVNILDLLAIDELKRDVTAGALNTVHPDQLDDLGLYRLLFILRLQFTVEFPVPLGFLRQRALGLFPGFVDPGMALWLAPRLLALFLDDLLRLFGIDDTGLQQLVLQGCHRENLRTGKQAHDYG